MTFAVKLTLIRLGAGALSVGPFIFSKASSSNDFLSPGSGGAVSSWGKAFKFSGTSSHLGFHTNPLRGGPGIGNVQWHWKLKFEVEVACWFALNVIYIGGKLCDFGVFVCGCFLGVSADVARAIMSLSGFPFAAHELKRVMKHW